MAGLLLIIESIIIVNIKRRKNDYDSLADGYDVEMQGEMGLLMRRVYAGVKDM